MTVDDSTPVITGIDPSVWGAGNPTSVTISGQYFGSNSTGGSVNLSPQNPAGWSQPTITHWSDQQITFNITPPANEPGETVGVSVTSSGYGGKAFNGQSAGQSPSSASVYAVVHSALGTPEITVIGWVNGNATDIVNTVNQGPTTAALKTDLNNSTLCIGQMFDWFTGYRSNLVTSTDAAYANAWLLQQSGNSAPPSTIVPSQQQSAQNFRIFNDFGGGGGFYQVGPTPNPCKGSVAAWYTPFGQASQYMGAGNSRSGQTYLISEGRVGAIGRAINQTINGRSTPFIWSVIEFNSSGVATYSDVGMFPTYSVYVNGNLQVTYPQSPAANFIVMDETYQRTPSQIP